MIRKHWKVWLALSLALLTAVVGVAWVKHRTSPVLLGNTGVTLTPVAAPTMNKQGNLRLIAQNNQAN